MPSIFKWGEHDSSDAADRRLQDLAVGGSESDQGVGGRTRGLSPEAPGASGAEARLISHQLLVRLRSYLRLRALVIAYLRVQAKREWLGRRQTSLQKAGAQPDVDFWEGFQGEFSGMGLRSDFPARLLTGEDKLQFFVDLVEEFDERYANVATAAEAALNPNQSAQSATEALEHVSSMLRIGRKVAEKCQEEAYTLLDELYETVTEIFAGEERSTPAEDRDKEVGRIADLAPSGAARADDTDGREKQLSGTGAGPDVAGHQLTRSKGAP